MTEETKSVPAQLFDLLINVFNNICLDDTCWFEHNTVLRPVLFRRRIGLEFDLKYFSIVSDRALSFDLTKICEDLVAKHPDKSAKDVAIKFCSHALTNDVVWAKAMGLQHLLQTLRGGTPTSSSASPPRETGNTYRVRNVRASDYAYGTTTYSEQRYFRQDIEIPEDVLANACENDDVDILLDYLREELSEYDPVDWGDIEYGDTDMVGTEEFNLHDTDDLTETLNEMMEEYMRNNNL